MLTWLAMAMECGGGELAATSTGERDCGNWEGRRATHSLHVTWIFFFMNVLAQYLCNIQRNETCIQNKIKMDQLNN